MRKRQSPSWVGMGVHPREGGSCVTECLRKVEPVWSAPSVTTIGRDWQSIRRSVAISRTVDQLQQPAQPSESDPVNRHRYLSKNQLHTGDEVKLHGILIFFSDLIKIHLRSKDTPGPCSDFANSTIAATNPPTARRPNRGECTRFHQILELLEGK